jgi:hypothetical protein
MCAFFTNQPKSCRTFIRALFGIKIKSYVTYTYVRIIVLGYLERIVFPATENEYFYSKKCKNFTCTNNYF